MYVSRYDSAKVFRRLADAVETGHDSGLSPQDVGEALYRYFVNYPLWDDEHGDPIAGIILGWVTAHQAPLKLSG